MSLMLLSLLAARWLSRWSRANAPGSGNLDMHLPQDRRAGKRTARGP